MTEKPLNLGEMKKKVDISNAKCIYCDGEVVPNAIISGIIEVSKTRKVLMENEIQTYWKCDNCDKITLAILDTKIIRKPSELIGDIIKVDDKVFVNTKLVQRLLQEIENKIKEAEKDIETEKKEGDSETVTGYKFRKTAFEEMKDLVRKWFVDVFEDENEREKI